MKLPKILSSLNYAKTAISLLGRIYFQAKAIKVLSILYLLETICKMNKILFIFSIFSQFYFSQQDERPIVGVSAFSCDENPRFVKLVTEKLLKC